MNNEYRVLVVDDSIFAQKVIQSCLAETEFKVVATARTVEDAIQQYRNCSPDITLLDMVLPDQEGAKALEKIMGMNRHAKVLMVSSLGTADTVTDCLALGAKHFVQKPINKDSLLTILRQLVAQPQA